ncbi:FAD binding domain-containing protein [Paracoccus laeviglucosivorans]|uniref:Xanthine dehydrogenase YagS FAD-binding subunit n=1 Tax=Paracoccus laeviglucosivorans TaxID=1197861 RepID=A0A521FQ24_9RHOB|nr:xanthine dehydrogenase family protein subunit M [Paracoccus laeviglucosivorans]SMO98337.1 xanthine dehydrogenase YagS FAD-binding subunit [Paracoccus laeviglucosivorans]
MKGFDYARASDLSDAIGSTARLIAGGTNLLDLMKLEVETPEVLLDINRIGLDQIATHGEGLRIGALVTNADCAADLRIRQGYPLLSRAILAGASPQLRNRATTGGNLCQRTRCGYFTDLASRCNKRQPGSGCDAIGGVTRNHAILGASVNCIATYPGDMAVALAALDGVVQIAGPDGMRNVPVRQFHRLPEDDPSRDNVLAAGEVITSVTLPAPGRGRQIYRKVRDRASYAFALVSVAAIIDMVDGRIARADLAFGGVAHKPWHDPLVGQVLLGERPSPALFRHAAELLLEGAQGHGGNDFKIPLLHRTLGAVLTEATGGSDVFQL